MLARRRLDADRFGHASRRQARHSYYYAAPAAASCRLIDYSPTCPGATVEHQRRVWQRHGGAYTYNDSFTGRSPTATGGYGWSAGIPATPATSDAAGRLQLPQQRLSHLRCEPGVLPIPTITTPPLARTASRNGPQHRRLGSSPSVTFGGRKGGVGTTVWHDNPFSWPRHQRAENGYDDPASCGRAA